MVIDVSTSLGPPAGSTRTGCGAKAAGAPLWHAVAASTKSSAAVSLEKLKVVPHDQGEGTDGAAQGGKGRVAVDRPAQLGEGDGMDEPVLRTEREDGPGNDGGLADARLAGELDPARHHLEGRPGAAPEGG